ncbi:MAG TPA: PepSY domain-containing protein [Nevskiales bacterium]|nr:PepSY domain-containing protein [Nevskiales bacterium]
MRKSPLLALVAAAILLGSLAVPADARPDRRERAEQRGGRERHGDDERRWESRKGVLSRDEAARRAQREHGGRVLSVDLLQPDDAPARYRIKLLSNNGNVRTVDVDALED